MIYEQAEALLAEIFAPLTTDEFFDAVGRTCLFVKGTPTHPRRQLFGDDPKRTMLSAFLTHSSKTEWHSKRAREAPPTPRPVASADEFLELIRHFHARDYTVRIPDLIPLSPQLQRFARALEIIMRQPVGSALFWSAAGADAIIHYDKPANIIVQLEGTKRWYISTDPPGLQNKWMQVGEPVPSLERHRVIDVEPGDLIFIPGGTPHTVESTTESLHLAVLFEPITLREVVLAAVDFLSDSDRSFRETAVSRTQDIDFHLLSARVVEGLQRLLAQCRSGDFLEGAMDLRAARMTAALPPLASSSAQVPITRETRVKQSRLAISYLRPSFASLNFSQPGAQIPIHPGVESELRFITSTDSFRVADVPGGSSEDVKIALVTRLIDSGFLQIAD